MLTGHWDEEDVEEGDVFWEVGGKLVVGRDCVDAGFVAFEVGWVGEEVELDVRWLVDADGQEDGTEVVGTVWVVLGAAEVLAVVAVVELLKHPIKSTVMLWAPWLGVILMAVTSLLKVSINWPLSTV